MRYDDLKELPNRTPIVFGVPHGNQALGWLWNGNLYEYEGDPGSLIPYPTHVEFVYTPLVRVPAGLPIDDAAALLAENAPDPDADLISSITFLTGGADGEARRIIALVRGES